MTNTILALKAKVALAVNKRKHTAMTAFTLPRDLFGDTVEFGFDFGSSLVKVAYISPSKDENHCELRVLKFPNAELESVLLFLQSVQAKPQAKTMATGVWVVKFRDQLQTYLKTDIEELDEFTSFVTGFVQLMGAVPKQELVHPPCEAVIADGERKLLRAREAAVQGPGSQSKVRLPWCEPGLPEDWYAWTRVSVPADLPYAQADPDLYPCLLVMVGSVCGIFRIESNGHSRLAMTVCSSGKTLQSMAALFLGVRDYEEMMRLAEAGSNANLDLLMSDPERTVQGQEPAGDDSLVYRYGKALGKDMDSFRQEDVIRTILCHVTGDLSRIVAYKAQAEGVRRVFFCGSAIGHPLFREEITRSLINQKKAMPEACVEYNFLLHGGHYGVIGALLAGSAG